AALRPGNQQPVHRLGPALSGGAPGGAHPPSTSRARREGLTRNRARPRSPLGDRLRVEGLLVPDGAGRLSAANADQLVHAEAALGPIAELRTVGAGGPRRAGVLSVLPYEPFASRSRAPGSV